MSDKTNEENHGWIAVPRSLDKLVATAKDSNVASSIDIQDIPIPNTPLVQAVTQYAKQHLSEQTFNHSMRVYYYGRAIQIQHFPNWHLNAATLLLTSLLHDIGTIPKNQTSTHLSFEFQGGYIALDLLKSHQASLSQAEAVCETIIRHQDLGETGNITTLTAIIHFATVFDNAGLYPHLVHEDTIKSVVARYPRKSWTGCFASVVRKECELKPWANTTRIEGFAEMVEANKVMEPYDY